MGWWLSRPGRFIPAVTRYPFYVRMGLPQDRPGRVLKISPPPGFHPQTVQPDYSQTGTQEVMPSDAKWPSRLKSISRFWSFPPSKFKKTIRLENIELFYAHRRKDKRHLNWRSAEIRRRIKTRQRTRSDTNPHLQPSGSTRSLPPSENCLRTC